MLTTSILLMQLTCFGIPRLNDEPRHVSLSAICSHTVKSPGVY